MVKLYKRNSKVLTIDTGDDLLRCCGICNLDGSVTVGIINRHKEAKEIQLDTALLKKSVRVYEYDPQNVPYNIFGDLQDYSARLPADAPTYTLKPESIVYFTTDYAEKSETVRAENLQVADGNLTWSPVSDKNHCYYRIFANGTQIASTIACDLPISDEAATYEVLSVDQWGNV